MLAFLYSSCTACVLIAQQIRGALDELAHPPPVLLVSVDPAADTPARVQAFLRRVSLAGRAQLPRGAARRAAPRVARLPRLDAGHRLRTSNGHCLVLLIDAAGRERVLYEAEQLTPEALAHDIGGSRRADTLAAR